MDDEQEIYKLWRISKFSAFEIVLFDFFYSILKRKNNSTVVQ
jgi:hypothetical protein